MAHKPRVSHFPLFLLTHTMFFIFYLFQKARAQDSWRLLWHWISKGKHNWCLSDITELAEVNNVCVISVCQSVTFSKWSPLAPHGAPVSHQHNSSVFYRRPLIPRSFSICSCQPSSSMELTPLIRWDGCPDMPPSKDTIKGLFLLNGCSITLKRYCLIVCAAVCLHTCKPLHDCLVLLIGVHLNFFLEKIHWEFWIRTDICFYGYSHQLCDHRVRFLFLLLMDWWMDGFLSQWDFLVR